MSGTRGSGSTRGDVAAAAAPVVLLVEDSSADAALVRDLLEEIDSSVRLVHRPDVPSACRWLRGESPEGGAHPSAVAAVEARQGAGSEGGEDAGADSAGAGAREGAAGPQLVLCDVRLPGVGGTELLDCIRSSSRWGLLPVVMISTSDHLRDVKACLEAGANAYVVKSSDPEVLAERLRSVLRLIHRS